MAENELLQHERRRIALFPLPNVVHFPHTDLRLHIFETRYRQLIAELQDLDEDQRLIGMVLLEASESGGSAQIYRTGTAGRLTEVEPLPDGRYNIVLHGVFRFTVEREVSGTPYRQAVVRELEEARVDRLSDAWREPLDELEQLAQSLATDMPDNFPLDPETASSIVAEGQPEALINLLAAEIELSPQQKIKLLSQELPQRLVSILRVLRANRRSLDLLLPYRHLASGVSGN